MILGIVCASSYEARPLVHARTVIGRVYSVGPAAFLAVSGAGAGNAASAADCLLAKGIDALISWGLAAALKPGLAAGDVVLAEGVVAGRRTYKISRSWRTAMRKRLADFTRVYDGVLAHSDGLLTRPTDKQLLYDSSSAIAVDRESAAVAEVAKKAGIPFLALKVIADSANLRLPSRLSTHLEQDSDLSLHHILAGVGPRLWQWPATLKLGMSSRKGLEKLEYMASKLERDLLPPANVRRETAKAG